MPPLLTRRDAIEMATIGGARTAHLDHKIGRLSPGKEADINVPATVVTLMDTSNLNTVFVAGRVVKCQGKLVGVDLGRLR